MLRGAGSPLINIREPGPQTRGRAGRHLPEEEEIVIKWLARVRGPESVDAPLHHLPPVRGVSTRVVVTKYELPRQLLAPHDVHGDSQGIIRYTPHRSPYIGKLDSAHRGRQGVSRPRHAECAARHASRVGRQERHRRFSEQWDHFLTGLDTRTGRQTRRYSFVNDYVRNSSGMSNFAMDDQGFAYETSNNGQAAQDRHPHRRHRALPLPEGQERGRRVHNTITPDGRYWVGGDGNYLGLWDTKTREFWDFPARTPFVSYSRGAMDTNGNAWFTGRGSGLLVKLDIAAKKLTEYAPPLPYTTAYEALADKNGDVWVAPIQAGRYFRFNPRTEKWIAYPMPEPVLAQPARLD